MNRLAIPLPLTHRCATCGEYYHITHVCPKSLNLQIKMTTQSSFWPFPKPEEILGSLNRTHPDGPRVCHAFYPNEKGGVSIAYEKASDTKNARMVWVSVAYCSPHDSFSRKVGTSRVLELWNDGERVLVPARTANSDASIVPNLRNMFWYSLYK